MKITKILTLIGVISFNIVFAQENNTNQTNQV